MPNENKKPQKLTPRTRALAINGVVRMVHALNSERALHLPPNNAVVLPREEADAMAAVIILSLQLDATKIVNSGSNILDLLFTSPRKS